jgi:hypothetical protein
MKGPVCIEFDGGYEDPLDGIIDDDKLMPEEKLWLSVLARAIEDLVAPLHGAPKLLINNPTPKQIETHRRNVIDRKGAHQRARESALTWFNETGESTYELGGFHWVCELLDISPEYIVSVLESRGAIALTTMRVPRRSNRVLYQ